MFDGKNLEKKTLSQKHMQYRAATWDVTQEMERN